MKPKANIMQWTSMNVPTTTRREPSFTIQRSNFSRIDRSLGASPLTSPDKSIRISGVDLDLSDMMDRFDIEEPGEPRFGFDLLCLPNGDLRSSM